MRAGSNASSIVSTSQRTWQVSNSVVQHCMQVVECKANDEAIEHVQHHL
jgi:hypothetical protein